MSEYHGGEIDPTSSDYRSIISLINAGHSEESAIKTHNETERMWGNELSNKNENTYHKTDKPIIFRFTGN